MNGIGRRADLLDTRGSVELKPGQNAGRPGRLHGRQSATRRRRRACSTWRRRSYQARDRDAAVKTLQKAKADFGLQPSSVHPTEQQVCQTLLNELKVRYFRGMPV